MSNIKKYITNNIINLVLIVTVLCLIISIRSCNSIKNDLVISNQNISSLSDSIRYEKNKVGDIEASKKILISDVNNLNNLNSKLYNELKKEKGKVAQLNELLVSIKVDTIYITNTLIQYSNGEYGLEWVYDTTFNTNNSRLISGISKFRLKDSLVIPTNTLILDDIINFNLVTGIREKDGFLEIFARSDYPGFNIIKLDGAIIDPNNNPILNKFTQDRKFHIGPYIGLGVGNNLKPSIQIGIGIQYSFFKF